MPQISQVMAAVENSDAFYFPFYTKHRSQPSVHTAPLVDVATRWNAWRRSDYFYPEMIPEPDYSDSDHDDDDDNEEEVEERLRDVEEKSEDEDDRRRRPAANSDSGDRLRGNSDSVDRLRSNSDSVDRLRGNSDSGDRLRGNSDSGDRLRGNSDSGDRLRGNSDSEQLIQPKKPSNPYLQSSERQKLHKELKFSQKYGKGRTNQRTELQVALEKYTEGRVQKDLQASRQSSLEKILQQQAKKIELQEQEGGKYERPDWIERLHRQHFPRRADPKTDEFFRVHAKVVSSHFMDEDVKKGGVSSSASEVSE